MLGKFNSFISGPLLLVAVISGKFIVFHPQISLHGPLHLKLLHETTRCLMLHI